MQNTLKATLACLVVLASTPANADLIDFTITGTVITGDEIFVPNAFNWTSGDTITAYGTFDDSELVVDPGDGSGLGTRIIFGSDTANTIFIDNLSGTILSLLDKTADDTYGPGAGASLAFNASGSLWDVDFDDFLGVGFNSSFMQFDDTSVAFGAWDSGTFTPQVIPVPAAVWLFGSGLLGLVGIARKKRV